jgi:hypothetical protein
VLSGGSLERILSTERGWIPQAANPDLMFFTLLAAPLSRTPRSSPPNLS